MRPALDDVEARARPRGMQRGGSARRADHVVPPVDDGARQRGERLTRGAQLGQRALGREEAAVQEVVRGDLRAREELRRLVRAPAPRRVGVRPGMRCRSAGVAEGRRDEWV